MNKQYEKRTRHTEECRLPEYNIEKETKDVDVNKVKQREREEEGLIYYIHWFFWLHR